MYGEEEGRELLKDLKAELKGFPKKFESLFDFNVSTVAIDLGLDRGKFHFFEANTFPCGTFARGEIALLRAAHAKYLYENKLNKNLLSYQELISKLKDQDKEIKRLKDDLKNIR